MLRSPITIGSNEFRNVKIFHVIIFLCSWVTYIVCKCLRIFIQMDLNERLSKFKLQQERCQTTLSGIAANHASISMPKLAPGVRPVNAPLAPVKPLQPIKFSNDTERLQHINSVRKSVVGAQIKLVIELLYKVISKKIQLNAVSAIALPFFD